MKSKQQQVILFILYIFRCTIYTYWKPQQSDKAQDNINNSSLIVY